MDLQYVEQKMTAAIEGMATSALPIQTRLEYAFSTLAQLDENDFPTDLGHRWRGVMEMAAANPGTGEGRIPATCRAMSNDDAESLAEEIVGILDAVRAELVERGVR